MMATDKLLHLLVGAVITLALGYVIPLLLAFIASLVIGFVKEGYDYYHPATNTCDGMDFIATAGGGGIAAVLILLVQAAVTALKAL